VIFSCQPYVSASAVFLLIPLSSFNSVSSSTPVNPGKPIQPVQPRSNPFHPFNTTELPSPRMLASVTKKSVIECRQPLLYPLTSQASDYVDSLYADACLALTSDRFVTRRPPVTGFANDVVVVDPIGQTP